MNDVFYIILTFIFGVFVLFVMWWLYRYVRTPSLLSMNKEDLSDREKDVLNTFCTEMKRARLSK